MHSLDQMISFPPNSLTFVSLVLLFLAATFG